MWWMLPLATAALGASKANRQAEQQKQYNLAQAEATRYSPWTGRAGQLDNSATANAFEGAVGGGVQGLGIAQGLGMGPMGAAKMNAQQQANSDALGAQPQQSPWWTQMGYGQRNV